MITKIGEQYKEAANPILSALRGGAQAAGKGLMDAFPKTTQFFQNIGSGVRQGFQNTVRNNQFASRMNNMTSKMNDKQLEQWGEHLKGLEAGGKTLSDVERSKALKSFARSNNWTDIANIQHSYNPWNWKTKAGLGAAGVGTLGLGGYALFGGSDPQQVTNNYYR